MSDRVEFDAVCPNNHNQSVTFDREEFERKLKAGGLTFHCNTCDTNWTPSRDQIAKIRKELERHSS